jgi:hypothetical protein
MHTEKHTIIFELFYQGETYQVQTYRNQYHTLMTLIADKLFITGFGLCCGMGSCCTCMVQICDKYSAVKRNVLACDIQVNDSLANTQIIIPDNIY